jgi:hypothetical protein
MNRSWRRFTLGALVGLSVLVLAQAPAQAQYRRSVFPAAVPIRPVPPQALVTTPLPIVPYSNALMYRPYGLNANQTAAYNAYLRNQTLAYNIYLRNQYLLWNQYLWYQTLLYNSSIGRGYALPGQYASGFVNSNYDTQASCNNNDANNNNNNAP